MPRCWPEWMRRPSLTALKSPVGSALTPPPPCCTLQDIGPSDFSAIAAAWFPAAATGAAAFFPGVGGTLRLKSRKPVVVAMSAVW